MKYIIIIFLFFLTALLLGSYVLQEARYRGKRRSPITRVIDTTLLRIEILKSIKVPFKNVDTIILSEKSGVIECGNITKEELENLPRPFKTEFDNKPFIQMLSKNTGCQVITSKLFFYSVLSDEKYSSLSIDSLWKNKVKMTIDAEISKEDGNIIVHEAYELNGVYKNVGKRFYLDRRQVWHYE